PFCFWQPLRARSPPDSIEAPRDYAPAILDILGALRSMLSLFDRGATVGLRWGKGGWMVGLLRGPAGARSQRPARHPRFGHRPDWPTQPRSEGLCRPVRSFLRPPQRYF